MFDYLQLKTPRKYILLGNLILQKTNIFVLFDQGL